MQARPYDITEIYTQKPMLAIPVCTVRPSRYSHGLCD